MGARAAADEAKAAKKQAERDAALGKIMGYKDDYFAGHHKEIAEQTRIMQEAGLAAMNAGAADPAVGADALSQAYQKELTKLNQMSTISKQFKSAYEKFKQDVDGKGYDFFDTESLQAGDQYFRTKIADVMADPTKIQSPPLRQAKVYASLVDNTNAIAAAYNTAVADGAPLNEKMALDIVRETMVDPQKGPGNIEAGQRAYDVMPSSMQEEIKMSAQKLGVTIPEAVQYRFGRQKFESQAPYNAAQEAMKFAKEFEISTSSRTGAEEFYRGPNKDASLASGKTKAKVFLFAHPDALTAQADRLGIKQGALSYEEFVDQTARKLAEEAYAIQPKKTESGIVSGSGKNPEQQKRADDWLQKVYGTDLTQAQQALDIARGVDFGQGLTVDRIEIFDNGGIKANFPEVYPEIGLESGPKKYIRFALKGDVKSRLTKKEIADAIGVPVSNVKEAPDVNLESGQVEMQYFMPLTPETSQFIKTFYNDAEKAGRRWEGAGSLPQYGAPASVEDVLQAAPTPFGFNQPQPAKTTTYNYKK